MAGWFCCCSPRCSRRRAARRQSRGSAESASSRRGQDTDQKMTRARFSEFSQGTRLLMWSVLGFGALLGADRVAARGQTTGVSFSFKNIATEAGLVAKTIYGGLDTNRYLLETTGTGAAAFDYDGDGWIDIFLVNGTTLEGFPAGQEPTNHLYRNKGNGTFEDVTARAGLAQGGWGQGVCTGDYDNDGHDDLFVTYWGQNRLYRNKGDGTFEDSTAARRPDAAAHPLGHRLRLPRLQPRRPPRSSSRPITSISISRRRRFRPRGCAATKACRSHAGRPGLPGGKNVLYRNRGNGAFEDVSDASGIAAARGTYGLGVSHGRLRQRWLARRVRRQRFQPKRALPQQSQRHLHRYRRSPPAVPTARMGSRRRAWASRSATTIATARWTSSRRTLPATRSTLYANTGKGACEDRTFAGGIGLNTRWLGWGVGFVDLDNDGWLDLFLVNGHVYPEVRSPQDRSGLQAAQGRLPEPEERAFRRCHASNSVRR